MKHLIVIVMVLAFSGRESQGQALIGVRYPECDTSNPHKYKLNTRVNNIKITGDTVMINITWMDNCSAAPKFDLQKVVNDTIYLEFVNLSDGESFCGCAFDIELKLNGMDADKQNRKNYHIRIGDKTLGKEIKRYKTDGYFVEYFPERTSHPKIFREIFTNNGKLVAEVFYDKEGNITVEKLYHESWGFLEREKRFKE